MMNDIKDALLLIAKQSRARDKVVASLYKKGWRMVRIADHLGVSRQRVGQILERLSKKRA